MSTTRRVVVVIAAMSLVAATASAAARGPSRLILERMWERTVDVSGLGVTTATAADLDGDGTDELLLHNGRGNEPSGLVVVDGKDGGALWHASFPGRSCLLVADVDDDGWKEVVAACGGDLSVFDGRSGETLSGAALRGPVGDLAFGRGGRGPFLVCTSGTRRDDDLVVLAGSDLSELWHIEAEAASGPFAQGFTHPTVLDVDDDGTDEIVVAENGNRLVCFSSAGELRWDVGLGRRERLDPAGVVSSRPVVANLLGDGIAEMAVGCFAGAVVVLDAPTGEVLDRVHYGGESHEEHLDNPKIPSFIRAALGRTGEPINCLTPVELDGGPGLELVLGCSDGFLYAFDPGDGETMWRVDTRETVYDPCLLPDAGTLLAWDVTGAYLVDRASGEELEAPSEFGDTSMLLVCELDGEDGHEFVHVALEESWVTAWRVPAEGG